MRARNFDWIQRGDPFVHGTSRVGDDFPPILEHLIRQRGLPSGKDLEGFLHPRLRDLADPFLIPDMEPAVQRILLAADRCERVCIFGDYDVDGVTSITLMRQILRAYGLDPQVFIPKRGNEGYGLSKAAIQRCKEEVGKPDLMITVDCGTVSVDEVASLRAEGIDVLIVDHHEPLQNLRPDCCALVNPKCGNEFTYLCAAGVVFKLGHALMKRRQVEGFDLKCLLDLVAVATISDIVPMIGENRLMVRHGLRQLTKTMNPGLKALQEIVGMSGAVTAMDVGFRIGPRLNAAGRMDEPADALATLMTDCRRLAMEMANKLEFYNRERQQLESKIRRDAERMLKDNANEEPVIVLGSREWHHGVVGIVASRLMRQHHKPTFIIAIDNNGIGKGSGRSIPGISLVQAIRHCQDDLLAGGGHDMAAGLSIHEDFIAQFRANFATFVMGNTTPEQRMPKLVYDAEIDFAQLSLEFMSQYDLLQPFGNGNPQPVFVTRNVELSRPPLHMKNHHLRLSLRQGYQEQDAVYFGGGEYPLPDPPWDIAFTIDRNTFRGRTSLQLVIQDVRSAQANQTA